MANADSYMNDVKFVGGHGGLWKPKPGVEDERRAPEAGKFRVQYSGVLSAELPDLSSYNLMNAREKLETERLAGLSRCSRSS